MDYKWDSFLADIKEDIPCLCKYSKCRGFLMLSANIDRNLLKYKQGLYVNYQKLFYKTKIIID